MDSETRYELTGRVAVSATATVWRARDTALDRTVAIKALLPEVAALPGQRARLREEARVLGDLVDEHIVAVYDLVELPEDVWLVEEWVDGATLRRVRDQAGRLTPEQAIGVVRGALQGLARVHERGVVHGDVAPSNILVTLSGVSKLCDFGLAAPVGTGRTVAGTPATMSPEAVRGEPLSPASDVYSAGAVLASLLTGGEVFAGPDTTAVLARHLDVQRPALDAVPAATRVVLRRCLSVAPSERPSDAAAMLSLLEDAADRDLGAGWLGRAGVGALVTTAVGAPGAAAARHLAHGTRRSRTAGHLLTGKPAMAALAALVVGGTVGAVAISRASSGSPTAAPSTTPTTVAVVRTPATTPATASAARTPAPSVAPSRAPATASAPAIASSAAVPLPSTSPTTSSGPITATGVVTYERGTHSIGNVKDACVELKTASSRYILEASGKGGYTVTTAFGFGGVLQPARTGINVGEVPDGGAPRWPVGAHITVTGMVDRFGAGDVAGCPDRPGLVISAVGT